MEHSNRYQQVEDLFHLALEQGPRSLETACAGDAVLRAEVDALLASYRAWTAAMPPPALPCFGEYECDEVLGSGGMGTVYRAHRKDEPFRHVAVKVLHGS